jgi:hypothetical protein
VVAVAGTLVRCDYCGGNVPPAETYRPFPHGPVVRCRDTAACAQRQLTLNDPTISDWDRPSPPPSAPAGARCAACGAAEDLYNGGHAYFCRSRAECVQREAADLSPWRDGGPDSAIATAGVGGTLRLPAPHPPEVPPERTELDPAQMAALASQEALGRKRER